MSGSSDPSTSLLRGSPGGVGLSSRPLLSTAPHAERTSGEGKSRRSNKLGCHSQCKDSAKSAEVLFTKIVEVLSRLGSQEGRRAAVDAKGSGCSDHEVRRSNLVDNLGGMKMLLFSPIFKCVICFELLRDPVQCPHCAHVFCRTCCCRRFASDFLNPGGAATRIKISRCPVCKNFVHSTGFVPGTFVKHAQRAIEFMYETVRSHFGEVLPKGNSETHINESSTSRPTKTVELPEPFPFPGKITETDPQKSANKVSLNRLAELTRVNTTKVVTTRRKGKRVCSQHPDETIVYFSERYCLLMCEKCLSLCNYDRCLVSNVNDAYKTLVDMLRTCSDYLKEFGESLYEHLGKNLLKPRKYAIRAFELHASVMRTAYTVREMIGRLGKYELLNMSLTLMNVIARQFKEIEKMKDRNDCRWDSGTAFCNLAKCSQSVANSLEVLCADSGADDEDNEDRDESEDNESPD